MSVTKAIDVDTATPCLSPEVMATFAEGRLSGDERIRALAHLADCADCRELLAGAVAFLDEDGWEEDEPVVIAEETQGKVVRGPWRRWVPGLVTLAAVVVVGIGVAAFWSELFPRELDREQLASRFDAVDISEGGASLQFGGRMRGDNKAERPIEPPRLVRLGALLLDAQIAASGEAELWEDGRKNLVGELEEIEMFQSYTTYAKSMDPDGLGYLEEKLRDRVDDDVLFLDLGMWAEGGRLAMIQGDLELLETRRFRRFARIAAESVALRTDLPSVVDAVDTVAETLVAGASEDDLELLQEQFEAILCLGGDDS